MSRGAFARPSPGFIAQAASVPGPLQRRERGRPGAPVFSARGEGDGRARFQLMFVGILKLTFHIPHARSLKEKRSVVRKFQDRVRARFSVSIAEVEAQDLHQKAIFGVAVISVDAAVCDSVLAQVAHVAETQEEAVLTDRATELIPIGDDLYGGGSGDEQGDDDG